MELTTNSRDYLHTSAIGYMVNAPLSATVHDKIEMLQAAFVSKFNDAIWATPVTSLHVTLFDWLAPLVDYDDDKDRLFEELFPQYDAVLRSILDTVRPIDVTFNRLIISPSAIALASDKNSTLAFNAIRQKFLSHINLLPDTKQPPNIVHSTIIRFMEAISVDDVKQFADTLDINFVEHIDSFQLVRETSLPMLEYELIKKYPLIPR